MPWTKKQKGFFGARCGEGDHSYCDLLKHHGTKKEATLPEMFGEDSLEPVQPDGSGKLPRMEDVFREGMRPPPGARPMAATQWRQMGTSGQEAERSLQAMQRTGQEHAPYAMPDGSVVAYPKSDGPGQAPMKLDIAKGGIWAPMTGSQSTGTPFSPAAGGTH